MSEQGDPAPRRALPPRGDAGEDVVDDESATPRRGRWSATGPGGAEPPSRTATPIPPPAVLPVSEVAPASAGRRFSAVDLPEDQERPLPRRSALSPSATRARSPQTPDTADAPAPTPRSYRRLAVGSIIALILAAVVITAFVLTNPPDLARPGATPTPTIDPVATYLVQPDDLAAVRPGTTWTAATTLTEVDAATPLPACLAPVLEASPAPVDTLVRLFSPDAGTPAGLLHQVETYATPEEASSAYRARVTQLGSCERNTAWVQAGLALTGIADEATGAQLVLQGEEPEYHTILVSRTGTRVNVLDATQPDAAPEASALLPTLTDTLARQCTDNGTCPSTPSAEAGVPPANAPEGFLTGVDLPRITAGAGVWRGTPLAASVSTLGSRCESVDLKLAPAGSTSQQQLTLVLQDDAAAPPAFGVDEALYTFNTPEEAAGFVGALTGNIDDCANRTGTAEVARTGDITGTGTGTAWVITRKLAQSDATARFRVAAVAAGNHAVYLMVNPTAEFDFSDEAWHGVALRAAERLTQLP